MSVIQPWHVWIILGVIFVIIEIFDPALFFIALGIGAIVTGLLSLIPFFDGSFPLQIITFAVLSFIAFLFTRRIGKKVLRHTGSQTNVYALKGQTGHITKAVPRDGKGYVKVGSEEWVAVTRDASALEKGIKVKVLDIDGNKLVVEKAE